MINHAKRLRETRVDMLGTDDEEHYGHCVDAAKYIVELEKGPCRFHCRTVKEAFMAGVNAGLDMIMKHKAPEPEEAWDHWKKREQTKG